MSGRDAKRILLACRYTMSCWGSFSLSRKRWHALGKLRERKTCQPKGSEPLCPACHFNYEGTQGLSASPSWDTWHAVTIAPNKHRTRENMQPPRWRTAALHPLASGPRRGAGRGTNSLAADVRELGVDRGRKLRFRLVAQPLAVLTAGRDGFALRQSSRLKSGA